MTRESVLALMQGAAGDLRIFLDSTQLLLLRASPYKRRYFLGGLQISKTSTCFVL